MAAGVPPPPLNSPSGSYYWLEWYTNLTNFLNGTNIPWSNLNFTGSNLTDLQSRNHNDLQNIQGGFVTGTSKFIYHIIGCGYSDSVAGTYTLPTGWTIAHSGTGNYTITHNLGVTTTDQIIVASLFGTTAGYATCSATSNTAFSVLTFNSSGVATNLAFSFMYATV